MLQYSEYIDNKSLFEIIRRACNCVDSRLMDHGFRTAYIASRIVRAMNITDETKVRDICILALLHDVGAYKTEEISKMLQFETTDVWNHSIYGYLFIKYFSPLQNLAEAILFHHTSWEKLEEMDEVSDEVKMLAQIISIADRIDIYMDANPDRKEWCVRRIEKESGKKFMPWLADLVIKNDLMDSLEKCADDEAFNFIMWGEPLTQEEITEYLKMLIYTIDFRSRHTVTHTITTTSISYEIAREMNLDESYMNKVVCGALLHDIGKIGIPVEILEFPGKLSPQAMMIMRGHVGITEEIFGGVIDRTVQQIALRHHEKIDGSGYPLGLKGEDLTVGDRIVAVADIVSALAGTRSYKQAYPKERIVNIITGLKEENKIDARIVDIIEKNYDEIMEATAVRCRPVMDKYQSIQESYVSLVKWSQNY